MNPGIGDARSGEEVGSFRAGALGGVAFGRMANETRLDRSQDHRGYETVCADGHYGASLFVAAVADLARRLS